MGIKESIGSYIEKRVSDLLHMAASIDDSIPVPFAKKEGVLQEVNLGHRTVKLPANRIPEIRTREMEIVLPTDMDKPGFHIIGTTRMGKSVLIKQIMGAVKAANMRAVVNDPKGEFLSRFGDDKSIILNIFDKRSKIWSPLAEIFEEADYYSVASSFFPDDPNQKQPIFYLGPRMILAQYLRIVKEKGGTNTDLLNLSRLPVDMQQQLLQGSGAYQFVAESKNLAGAILANLQVKLKFLEYLPEPADGNYFSVREWVRNGEDGSWLFLTYLEKHIAIMRPFISAVLDQIALESLSLEPTNFARFWIFIDEIGRLQALPALLSMVAQGSGHGVRWVFAHQVFAQLVATYGEDNATTLSGNAACKFIFACGDIDGAGEWCSRMIGDEVVREKSRTFQSKETDGGDGVSIGERRLPPRPVVNPTDFISLKPLHCYVSLPGVEYTTMLRIDFDTGKGSMPAFDFRDSAIEQRLTEVSEALEKIIPEPKEKDGFMPVVIEDIEAITPQLETFIGDFMEPIPSVGDLDLMAGLD